MASVHLLNVSPGDCTIIRHNSNHVTMIDICDGNLSDQEIRKARETAAREARVPGNFGMCGRPTNPITYAKNIGITSIFRFILTHPDMDHMDGINALLDELGVRNFWDTGSRRDKPDFSAGPYLEEDWDRYEDIRDDNDAEVSTSIRRAGSHFSYANQDENGEGGGDGLYILAPNAELIKDSDQNDDLNDGSYVILYRSRGGRILIPGDAHDKTWEYVLEKYPKDVKNCSFLLAPHHGRDSGRSYDFLDHIQPKLTLIGCSPSKHIDYDQWKRRELDFITSNQAGNVVLEVEEDVLHVFIENETFAKAHAKASGANLGRRNSQGYVLLYSIDE
jgi:beta-lactamase superfamily II metal-dependent hydrolase